MRWKLICCGLLGALAAAPATGVAVGQFDDFENGSVQGWSGQAAPTNIASGGPAGVDDNYLQISRVNGPLGTNNTTQWTGNYSAAGIAKLNFQLNNLDVANELHLRISLFGAGGTFTTTNETVLPASSGWASVEFALSAATLTQTAGSGTLTQTLDDVETLLIRHDPDPISPSGQQNPVTGTLGIDNVIALPEPGPKLLLAAGIAAVSLLYARSCRRAAAVAVGEED